MRLEVIKDADVSNDLDKKLRVLLSHSFVLGRDAEIFSQRRYYREIPEQRFLLWKGTHLVAHAAVHRKYVLVNGDALPVSGVAEVCVEKSCRGQGLLKPLMAAIKQSGMTRGDAFSLLFGEEDIYSSSGYKTVQNLLVEGEDQHWDIAAKAMVLSLNRNWPREDVRLNGLVF